MTHEIDYSAREGRYNYIEVKDADQDMVITAWHRNGKPVRREELGGTGEEQVAAALDMTEGSFTVDLRPTYRVKVNPDGTEEVVQSELAYVTVRTDREVELGRVGPGYVPLQNTEAFRGMAPLLDQGVLKLECGGVLREGADVWLLGRFDVDQFGPVVREVFADEVVPYALFTNNHAGRRNATVAATPVRVVCANTLAMAEQDMERTGRAVSVRHTGDAALKMAEAAERLFGGIVERYEVIAKQYRALKQAILTDKQFTKLVLDTAVPDPEAHKRWNPEARMAAAVVDRAKRKRLEIRRLWEEGAGHSGDHSAWEAYNGLVQAIDHNEDLFPTKAGVFRTQALMDGYLRTIKDDTLAALVRHATQGAKSRAN